MYVCECVRTCMLGCVPTCTCMCIHVTGYACALTFKLSGYVSRHWLKQTKLLAQGLMYSFAIKNNLNHQCHNQNQFMSQLICSFEKLMIKYKWITRQHANVHFHVLLVIYSRLRVHVSCSMSFETSCLRECLLTNITRISYVHVHSLHMGFQSTWPLKWPSTHCTLELNAHY
jgi:hypothetical protein